MVKPSVKYKPLCNLFEKNPCALEMGSLKKIYPNFSKGALTLAISFAFFNLNCLI